MESKGSQARVEHDRKRERGDEKEGKVVERTGKCYRPTGGWAMRVRRKYHTRDLGQASGPGRSVTQLLESHAILGVMPMTCFSIVQTKR